MCTMCASILAHVNKKQFDPYSKDVIQFRWPNLAIHLTLPEYLFYYFIFYYQIIQYFPKVCTLIEVAYTRRSATRVDTFTSTFVDLPLARLQSQQVPMEMQDDADVDLIQIRLKAKNKKAGTEKKKNSKSSTSAKTNRSKSAKRQKVEVEGTAAVKKVQKKNVPAVTQSYENKLKRKQKKLLVASVNSHKISTYYKGPS